MIFNSHSSLVGRHALLSASDYHWLNYDEEKMTRVYHTKMASIRGTELHALAHEMIRLGVEAPDNGSSFSQYVNDGIGYRMKCEICFYYSDFAYGHADCAAFRNNFLRIHDLKTGVTEASPHQLEIYAAFFCLEYKIRPFDIEMELRIYQNDAVQVYVPSATDIVVIMEKIKFFDKHIRQLRLEDS